MAGTRYVTPYPQPVQSNGLPYAGGSLGFYLSGTSTPTPTYSDSGLTIPNTNPVVLDSAGDPGNIFLNPGIVYKVVLEDSSGNLIWTADPVYPFAPSTTTGLIWGGVSTGSANAQIAAASGFSAQPGQTVVFIAGFANTGPMTLNAGTGALQVYQPTTTGPSLLAGGEIQTPSVYLATYDPNLNSGAGGFQLVAPFSLAALGFQTPAAITPQGRLTLQSATPVMAATVSAATAIVHTPYLGAQMPVWNGTQFVPTSFIETDQLLSDTALSPAAALANKVYDIFGWAGGAGGIVVATRGPAWTNATTRGYNLTRVNGLLVNASDVTNGPKAGFGVYLGTIATDAGGATVSWTFGSGGNGGVAAVLNVWNMYNRVNVGTAVTDTSSYVVNAVGPRQAHASATFQVTWVSGEQEEDAFAIYSTSGQSPTAAANWTSGIGLDSTTVNTGSSGGNTSNVAGVSTVGISYSSSLLIAPQIGKHFVAPLETTTGTSITLNNLGNGSLVFRTRM